MLKWENIQDGILLHEMYIKDTNRLLLRHAIMDNTNAFELLEQCGPFPAQSVWTCITFCGMWWFMNITREKFKKAQGASEQPDVIEYLSISGTCISAVIICCLPWEARKDPCHWFLCVVEKALKNIKVLKLAGWGGNFWVWLAQEIEWNFEREWSSSIGMGGLEEASKNNPVQGLNMHKTS